MTNLLIIGIGIKIIFTVVIFMAVKGGTELRPSWRD
jgi:hypothetical protein